MLKTMATIQGKSRHQIVESLCEHNGDNQWERIQLCSRSSHEQNNPCGVEPCRMEVLGDVLSVHLFPVLTSHLRVDANEMSIRDKRRCYKCKE